MSFQLSARIAFESPEPIYQPGEIVQGLIFVQSSETVFCRQIAAEIFTLRGGTDERKWEKSGILASNLELKANKQVSFPFSFRIPGNPFDYSADSKQAQWTIQASFDVDGEFPEDVTNHFLVVQDRRNYRPEGGAPGSHNPEKPTVVVQEPDPFRPGDYLGAAFISLFPLGFIAGGIFLAWNGGAVPLGIRYFALAMVLGGAFVITRIFEGIKSKAGLAIANGFAVLSLGLAVLGGWVTWFAPHFAWGQPLQPAVGGLLSGQMTDAGIIGWVVFHVFTLFGLSVFHPDSRRKAAGMEMGILLVTGTVFSRGLAFGADVLLGGMEIQPYYQTAWIWAGLALVLMLMVLRRPGWSNLPFAYILPAAALALIPALLEWTVGGGNPLAAGVFGATLLALTVFILFQGSKNWLAERQLGKVEVQIGRTVVPVGATIPLHLSFTPRKNVKIDRIAARLVFNGSSGTFRNGNWETDSWVEDTINLEILKNQPVNAGVSWARDLSVTIPIGTRKTEKGTSQSYHWQLMITIEVEGYPDWTMDKEIELT